MRRFLILALAVCLVAVLSFGTLAWFTDDDSATNNFYIADSNDTADDVFSVDVKEDVQQDGKTAENGVDGYDFTDLLPGEKVKKAPYVMNTTSAARGHNQYIRVTVTVTKAGKIAEITGKNDISTMVEGFNFTNLVEDSRTYDQATDTMTYVYYVNKIVAAQEKVELFTHIQLPGEEITREEAAEIDGFSMNIKAEAVQTEYVLATYSGDVVADAKASFVAVGMN